MHRLIKLTRNFFILSKSKLKEWVDNISVKSRLIPTKQLIRLDIKCRSSACFLKGTTN